MMVLTLPIFFPIITQMGIDPIWFGVLVVLTLEMGLISPPVGLNVFIVKSVAPHVPLSTIFYGVMPFWITNAGNTGDPCCFSANRPVPPQHYAGLRYHDD